MSITLRGEERLMGWIPQLRSTDVLAAHAALLPTGKILHFSGSEYNQDQHDHNRNDHTRLYDCDTGDVTAVGSPVEDLFCCGHSLLADGNMLAAGGTASYATSVEAGGFHRDHWPGLRNSWIYDVPSSRWIERASLLPQPDFIAAARSAPSVISRRGMLQVFWVSRDSAVVTQFWPVQGKWSRPQILVAGDSPLAAVPGSSVSAVSRNTDKIDIFWTGADGGINSHFFSEEKPWNEHGPFNLVPGNAPLAAKPGASVGAVSRNTDKIDIFWTGADGGINSHFFSEAKPWNEHGPFSLVPGNAPLAAKPGASVGAVSRSTDKIDIFWTGADGGLNSHFFSEAKPWNEHGPFSLVPGNAPLAAKPGASVGAVSRNTDKIDIFWTGADGGINSHFFSEAKPWNEHGPFSLVPGNAPLAAKPGASVDAVSRNTDKIDIFWTGADGGINSHFFSEAKPWNEHGPFAVVGGGSPVAAPAGSAVASVTRGHDKIDLFWAGQGGAVNTLWWTEADGWGLDHRTAFGLAGGGRWYPTLVTLADGRVLAAGGHPAFTDSRHWNNTPETWDPPRDTWTIHGALGDLLAFVQYPRMHVLPDGTVFCATPLVSEGQLGFSITYDPDTEESFQVAPLGDPDYLAPAIASSIDTTSVLLPLRPSRNYAPSVLLCGGTTPLRIDLADNTPAWKAAGTRPLTGPRYNLNAVLLPSGEVFISGGVNDRTKDTTGVRTAEMYHPDSNTWDPLQDAQVVRNYHSVALLMPDGAVWTAGSNKNGEPSGPDHPTRELRIEVYRPWYFDQPRPQLVSAPARMTYARAPQDAITVEVASAAAIAGVAIIRTSSTTHAFSSDQRYVELSFTAADATHLHVIPPPSGRVAPPGVYLIFILDSAGVPSTGRFITMA
jgi:Galactose oxidase-like, Early set domain